MNYQMYIIDKESRIPFDVSELAHNISHCTTLEGQAGKLTFTLLQDPNGILQLSMGSKVLFWCGTAAVFKGYIFNIKTSQNSNFEITAYDQMRYLQNHDYLFAKDLNLKTLFQKICNEAGIKDYKVIGQAAKMTEKDNFSSYHFNDTSYFDMLQYAINETNIKNVKEEFEESYNRNIQVNSIVDFAGGTHYVSPNADNPASTNLKSGKAKLTMIKSGTKHPYHLIGVDCNVYGWVNENSVNYNTEKKQKASDVKEYKYFIRDNFGVLELNDIENNVAYRRTSGKNSTQWTGTEDYSYDPLRRENLNPLIIGDESLLTDYEYELDIDKNTYNQIFLMDTIKSTSETKEENVEKTNKIVSLAKQNDECVKKWGILRKIINLKSNYTDGTTSEKEKIEKYLELALQESSQISKTLKISALGYNGINAGDGFYLQLKRLGINELMYVISAEHNYEGNKHTMQLEVATDRNFTEILK